MKAKKIDLVAAVQDELRRVEAMDDEEQARTAHSLWPQVLDIQAQVASLRRSGVRRMRSRGLSLAEVGAILGMSPSRVKQIENGLERKTGGGT
jgi:DNA-directed RNA polymerase sigma subunit (sigma70/sigma32)